MHAVAITWQYHFYNEGRQQEIGKRTQKVVSSFSSTSLKLQLIKDPNPQTINQSKQHKLNQKSRPKSVNKQLNSQKKKKNRSLPNIKTQIRKSTQSLVCGWGLGRRNRFMIKKIKIKNTVEENSLSLSLSLGSVTGF